MSFEKRGHDGCHRVQKCSFQPIAKSNPVGDLNYSLSQLKALVNQLTQSLAALAPSYGSFYNVPSTPGLGQVLTPYDPTDPTLITNAVNFLATSPNNPIGPHTSDITIIGSNTIRVQTAGVYEINYSLLVSTSDTSGDGSFWAKIGLRITNPGNPNPIFPVESFQSHNLSVTTTIPTATGTITVAQCLPLTASFQIQLAAGSTVQLVNLSTISLTLCNGIGPTDLDAVNARITFERLSPIAS